MRDSEDHDKAFSLLCLMEFPGVCAGRARRVYAPRLHEDYIERGSGSFLGDFTGMPMSDEGRESCATRPVSLR